MNIVVNTSVRLSETQIREALMQNHRDFIVDFILELLGKDKILLKRFKEKLNKQTNELPFTIVDWSVEYKPTWNSFGETEKVTETLIINFEILTLEQREKLDEVIAKGEFTWDLPFYSEGGWKNITYTGFIKDVETSQIGGNFHTGTLRALAQKRSDNEKD